MSHEWDFHERLSFSEGVEATVEFMDALRNIVPGAVDITRATEAEDRQGTDYWIHRGGNLHPISVDVKNREFCPIKRWGRDDACIEVVSVWSEVPKICKPGWTVDSNKRTDYIAYTWPSDNGIRYWIVPFHPLCRAAQINWRMWRRLHGKADGTKGMLEARNNGYLTLSVYPPRSVIARAMRELMVGVTA